MAREYTVTSGAAVLANQAVTLVWISPPSNASIEILKCWIGQVGSQSSQQVRVQLGTQVSAYPTLVSTNPRAIKVSDPVSKLSGLVSGISGTGTNASTEGAGTKTVLVDDAFNNLTGYLWYPTGPYDSFLLNGTLSAGFFMHLPSAASSLSGWSFGVTYREL